MQIIFIKKKIVSNLHLCFLFDVADSLLEWFLDSLKCDLIDREIDDGCSVSSNLCIAPDEILFRFKLARFLNDNKGDSGCGKDDTVWSIRWWLISLNRFKFKFASTPDTLDNANDDEVFGIIKCIEKCIFLGLEFKLECFFLVEIILQFSKIFNWCKQKTGCMFNTMQNQCQIFWVKIIFKLKLKLRKTCLITIDNCFEWLVKLVFCWWLPGLSDVLY